MESIANLIMITIKKQLERRNLKQNENPSTVEEKVIILKIAIVLLATLLKEN